MSERDPGTRSEEGLQDICIMAAVCEAADTGRFIAMDWEYGQAGW